MGAVSQVNGLWRRLAGWAEARRRIGDPIREVVLPSPGADVLIGIATRIAFPSWRDRVAFAAIISRLPDAIASDPAAASEELARPQYAWRLPDAIREALDDFRASHRAGHRMLAGHRFVSLLRSVHEAVLREDGEDDGAWMLEAAFAGWEDDVLELVLWRAARRGTPLAEVFRGGLGDLLDGDRHELPRSLRLRLEEGALVFSRACPLSGLRMDDFPQKTSLR